ncbi:MAG TPA: DUF502 domain-containing protein [bacterium]|nr:DUF502 domain-containing protein [bacterium]
MKGGSLFGTLRRYFLAGILALLPVYVTAWILFKVFIVVDGNVRPLIAKWAGYEIPGLGFLTTILFVLLIGVFASNIIGRSILSRLEDLFAKVPLFSRIYISVKQIGEGVIGKRNLFERAVLFEYPRPGCWAVGFVTSRHTGALEKIHQRTFEHVFVPTTPNPTSGFLLFLPSEDLTDLGLSVEDALKLVISGGAVSPPPQLPASPDAGEGSSESVAAAGR